MISSRARLLVVAVHAFSNGSKPLAFTMTVPETPGTWSNANSPEESVVVEALYDPAFKSTCAPAIEARLESRTAPSTRNVCASAAVTIERRNASAMSARSHIRPRIGESGDRKLEFVARLVTDATAISADLMRCECWASIKGEVGEEFKRWLQQAFRRLKH